MRRGHGIAGLTQAARAKEQYTRTGEEVKAASMAAMREQMGTFKRNLEAFAAKYKADIRKDPAFRAQFQSMCANIGVDPLASNKGAWAELLGFGDFYYELGVQIVEACWATRGHNGGLMELPALLRYVNRRRGSAMDPISEDDVTRAIKKLRVLGSGFDVVRIGATTYVRSVPGELNMDRNRVLEIAQEAEGGVGCLSREALMKASGWTPLRTDEALQGLLREGLAMIDDGASNRVRLFWFPCVGKNQG